MRSIGRNPLLRTSVKVIGRVRKAVQNVDKKIIAQHGPEAYHKMLAVNHYNNMRAQAPHNIPLQYTPLNNHVRKRLANHKLGQTILKHMQKYGVTH